MFKICKREIDSLCCKRKRILCRWRSSWYKTSCKRCVGDGSRTWRTTITNGSKIETDAELEEYASLGKPIELTVLRNKEKLKFSVEPKLNESNSAYRIGLWVKDSSAGVGTVTFYEKDTGRFAALGHGIVDSDTGNLIKIENGDIYIVPADFQYDGII